MVHGLYVQCAPKGLNGFIQDVSLYQEALEHFMLHSSVPVALWYIHEKQVITRDVDESGISGLYKGKKHSKIYRWEVPLLGVITMSQKHWSSPELFNS